tara:strand:- start:41 stop:487 length:447 start_codon:yes stop_codon:yes gene_type:complete
MNTLKHIALLLGLFLSINSYSQKKQNTNINRVKAYKLAFITDQLNLTEKEAEKFWPIYNAHEKLILKLRIEERKITKVDDIDINNQKAKEIVNSLMELREKTYLENQVYFKKLKTFLPYKKILKLQIAEKEFRKTLFENLRKRRKRGF